jgi:hypothetical protein
MTGLKNLFKGAAATASAEGVFDQFDRGLLNKEYSQRWPG